MSCSVLQPYDDLPALVKRVQCLKSYSKRGAADAVLPSKLTNILAVGGNLIITAGTDTELGWTLQWLSWYCNFALKPWSHKLPYTKGIVKCLALQLKIEITKQYAAWKILILIAVLPKFMGRTSLQYDWYIVIISN